jgi:anti-sigma regulatory factor (Ser/Thr protein kinase)
MEWQIRIGEPGAATTSRRSFVRVLREACTPDSDFGAAETVYGELIANAIMHASGPIDVHVHGDEGESVTLDVYDTGPPFGSPPVLPPAQHESGRGLYIVSRICSDLSITRMRDGNKVSVTLPALVEADTETGT